MMLLRAGLLAATALLGACATPPPIDATGVDGRLDPSTAVAGFPGNRGVAVVWAGVIVSAQNLASATRMEVLGYPLDGAQRPRSRRTSHGRFMVMVEGYLETATYRPGRRVTVRGTVVDVLDARVGEAPYRYPVVAAQRLHLWPDDPGAYPPRVHFGLGVVIGN
jgi:outer membrane lipoprotein